DAKVPSNCFIVIKNPQNNKKIKTFKRTIDENFVNNYNQKKKTIEIDSSDGKTYLIINEFFRNALGIKKHEEVELEIKKASSWQKIFIIHWTHPNPTVQYANRATIVSLILAVIALVEPVIKPLFKLLQGLCK
ncbi:MAG TPA: hypothetical protein VK808_04570, partial [Bacteroidia bacterium]|nr:hypothetical protein [Bacteroidia bacterium]